MKKIIADREIEVNEEGYLVDFNQWDKEVGLGIAEEQSIPMTEKHWEVIEYLQDKHHKEELCRPERRAFESSHNL